MKNFSQQTRIPVLLRMRDVGRNVPSDVATTVFRLVQEALTNVARHSRAKEARVAVSKRNGTMRIEVQDNGCGFDPDKLPKNASGLANLRQRVRLNGGEFAIESMRDRGTTLRAALPVASEPMPSAKTTRARRER